MKFVATKKGLKSLNIYMITVQDVMLDRSIIKNDLDILQMMGNVNIELEGKNKIKISDPSDYGRDDEYFEIINDNGIWLPKK